MSKGLSLVIASIIIFLGVLNSFADESKPPKQNFENLPKDKIEGIIRNYILQNPELLLEAMDNLRQKRQREKKIALRQVISTHRKALLHEPNSPVGGNPKGSVTIVEFFDYRCVYCRGFFKTLAKAEKNYPQLRIVYKEFPILGAESVLAARAALAARMQGKYLVFHQALMTAKGPFTEENLIKIGAAEGLDVNQLKKDMMSPEIGKSIQRNYALAQALGIEGTPAFVIGEELVANAVDLQSLERMIQKEKSKSN